MWELADWLGQDQLRDVLVAGRGRWAGVGLHNAEGGSPIVAGPGLAVDGGTGSTSCWGLHLQGSDMGKPLIQDLGWPLA